MEREVSADSTECPLAAALAAELGEGSGSPLSGRSPSPHVAPPAKEDEPSASRPPSPSSGSSSSEDKTSPSDEKTSTHSESPATTPSSEKGTPSAPSSKGGTPPSEKADESAPLLTEEGEVATSVKNLAGARKRLNVRALRSTKTWEELGLSPDLLRGVHAKGFARPSRIQELALPLTLGSRRHLVAQAQNGSGKTAAFALVMLAKVDPTILTPQCLCISHTRELAQQNMDVVRELGKFVKVTSWLGVSEGEDWYQKLPAQIVVGTPGKLKEAILKKRLNPRTVKVFVLDEADTMMHVAAANMSAQVAEIRRKLPEDSQLLLFSATFPDRVKKFIEAYAPDANRIEILKDELALETVSQYYIECQDDSDKIRVLCDLYGCLVIGQSIIFANTRRTAHRVAETMKKEGHTVSMICGTRVPTGSGGPSGGGGGMPQLDHSERERVMNEFRNGETKVLISTDVLARGIDVPQVTLVINYDCPVFYDAPDLIEPETYIHRIGRTGRFGNRGLAITLVARHELHLVKQIVDFFECALDPLEKDPEKIENILKDLR